MAKKIEFLFDFASPNCYVAFAKLEEMKNNTGRKLEVVYSPILLGGLFKLTSDAPVPVGSHEFNYMERNLRRLSNLIGVEFHFSHEGFPVNSLKALRGFYYAESRGKGLEYLEVIFRECWVKDHDISDLSILREAVKALGFDFQTFGQFIENDETKLKLKQDTQRAFERGVFGAPTFFVDGEMYWGSPEVLWFLESTGAL